MKRNILLALRATLTALVAIVLGGCSVNVKVPSQAPASSVSIKSNDDPPTSVVVFAADLSGSITLEQKERYRKFVVALIKREHGGAMVYGYTFGKAFDLAFQQRVTSAKKVGHLFTTKIIPMKPIPGYGTFYLPVLKEASRVIQQPEYKDLPATIIVLSDGDFQDSIDDAKRLAAELHGIKNLKHLIVGPTYDKDQIRQKVVKVYSKASDTNWLLTTDQQMTDAAGVYNNVSE